MITIPAPPTCVCGDGEALHDLHPKTGIRTACSVHTGPRGTPCDCRVFQISHTTSIPQETS